MNEPQDQFDSILAKHLGRRLDPMLGHSAAMFQKHLRRQRMIRWGIGVAGTFAAAACVAILVLSLPRTTQSPQNGVALTHSPATATAPSGDEPVVTNVHRTVYAKLIDDGIVMGKDGTPLRQYRRQIVQQMQWYDPQNKTTVNVLLPEEETVYVTYTKE